MSSFRFSSTSGVSPETPLLDLTTLDLHKCDMSNPYETPMSHVGVDTESVAYLGELVRSWEKMRLRYNGILFGAGVIVMIIWLSSQALPAGFLILGAVPVAIGANVCFFLGPLAELYLRVFFHGGAPAPSLRKTLFFIGMLGSLCIFTLFAIAPLLG